MNQYEQFLVITLSTFLAVFLVLGIILFAWLIKIARTVSRIGEKAENVAGQVEEAGEFIRQAVAPFAFNRVISGLTDRFFKRND